MLSCAPQSHVATRSRRRYDVDVFFDRQAENSQAASPASSGGDKSKGKQAVSVTVETIPAPTTPQLAPAVSLFPATNMNQFDSKSEEYIPLDGCVEG